MRDNPSVVYSAMFMCDERQECITLLYASKRIQDKVKSLVEKVVEVGNTKTFRKLRVYEALQIITKEEQGE